MASDVPAVIDTTTGEIHVSKAEGAYELAKLKAGALASSGLVPTDYQKNIPNCLIALELAERTGSSAMMVMQNVHIIHGRPSWSSQFIIAALNSCGRFSPLRFEVTGDGLDRQCVAWAFDKQSGDRLDGPPVSLQMAKDEGWSTKKGSKWVTMPELMLRYRSAAFYGRLYAPDVLMGMQSSDEVTDVREPSHPAGAAAIDALRDVTPDSPQALTSEEQLLEDGLDMGDPARDDAPPENWEQGEL